MSQFPCRLGDTCLKQYQIEQILLDLEFRSYLSRITIEEYFFTILYRDFSKFIAKGMMEKLS